MCIAYCFCKRKGGVQQENNWNSCKSGNVFWLDKVLRKAVEFWTATISGERI